MSLRRVTTSVITIVIACACAVLVPTSQLRTYSVTATCCCPDPTHCHCPDHHGGHSKDTQLRACHRSTDLTSAPDAPELVMPELGALAPVAHEDALVITSLPAPHPAPSPARPAAPS